MNDVPYSCLLLSILMPQSTLFPTAPLFFFPPLLFGIMWSMQPVKVFLRVWIVLLVCLLLAVSYDVLIGLMAVGLFFLQESLPLFDGHELRLRAFSWLPPCSSPSPKPLGQRIGMLSLSLSS